MRSLSSVFSEEEIVDADSRIKRKNIDHQTKIGPIARTRRTKEYEEDKQKEEK